MFFFSGMDTLSINTAFSSLLSSMSFYLNETKRKEEELKEIPREAFLNKWSFYKRQLATAVREIEIKNELWKAKNKQTTLRINWGINWHIDYEKKKGKPVVKCLLKLSGLRPLACFHILPLNFLYSLEHLWKNSNSR